jgi:hypothetical protein
MNFLQQLAKKIVLKEYEKLHRSEETSIWFDNFKNLSLAYEQLLNESNRFETKILPNETRLKLLPRLLGHPHRKHILLYRHWLSVRIYKVMSVNLVLLREKLQP